MDLNLLIIFALQRLNRSLNHGPRRAIPEVALPDIDYELLAANRPRTGRAEREVDTEQGDLATTAGVSCV